MIGLKIAEGASEQEALAAVRSELAQPDLNPEQDYIASKNTLVRPVSTFDRSVVTRAVRY